VERTQVMKRALASYQELVNRVSDATTVMSEIPQTHAEVVYLHPPLITLRKADSIGFASTSPERRYIPVRATM